jgi:hypothetical protein
MAHPETLLHETLTPPASREETRRHSGISGNDGFVSQIVVDFAQMPTVQLTLAQAARLWQVDPALCLAMLDELVELRFLERVGDETYARPRR